MKIPQLDLTNFELPFSFKNGVIEIGIAALHLTEPINAHIRKHEGPVRDTDSEKIDIDNLLFSLREGGFVLKGDVRVRFRKLLGEAPVVGTLYTPWMTIASSFIEELTVDVVDGRLSVSHSDLHLGTIDDHYKTFFHKFVLPYLKNEVVKRINEQLSNFNGMTIEELVFKYGRATLKQKFESRIPGKDRMNTLLKIADANINRFAGLQSTKSKLSLVKMNARVSKEYLWLSIVKR